MRLTATRLPRLAASLLLVTAPVFAGLIENAGTGGIAMGVAPYGGAPNVGGPTYIANNFTGLNDILTSPGLGTLGGYLTASPVTANNIASFGPAALPMFGIQVGGANGNGAFGSGAAANNGSTIGFALSDSGPGGGSASYIISSESLSYTNAGAAIAAGTTYGAYLSIGGFVPLVGNADVAALRVHISDTAGVFGAGQDLPALVLAISRNGAGPGIGNYNVVTLGGGGAALILDNGVTGAFRALAVDNQALGAAIPVGDVISVSATVTAYSDPASIDVFFPDIDLLDLTGPLASLDLVSTAPLPEPSTFALFAGGLLVFALPGMRKRVRQKV